MQILKEGKCICNLLMMTASHFCNSIAAADVESAWQLNRAKLPGTDSEAGGEAACVKAGCGSGLNAADRLAKRRKTEDYVVHLEEDPGRTAQTAPCLRAGVTFMCQGADGYGVNLLKVNIGKYTIRLTSRRSAEGGNGEIRAWPPIQ